MQHAVRFHEGFSKKAAQHMEAINSRATSVYRDAPAISFVHFRFRIEGITWKATKFLALQKRTKT